MDLNRLEQLAGAMGSRPPKGLKGLFYSESGNGKSHLAMELADVITPPDKFWVMVDTSDNYSILDQINGGEGPRKNCNSIPFTFIEDLELIAEAIATRQPGWGDIATLILDEGSVMAQQDVDRVFDQRVGEGKTMEETPGWSEYRPAMIRYRRMLDRLMKIPGLNLLIVAHEHAPVDKLPKAHGDFPIATYKAVKKALTFVARVEADNKAKPGSEEVIYERTVQVHPTKAYDAKCRLGTDIVKMPTDWFISLCETWLASSAPDNSKDDTVEDIEQPDITPTSSPKTDDAVEALDSIDNIDFSDIESI